ncbi:ABC transporter permease subunit [bacterium]|nr:ABC transporter permease subunit [bacterium]
MLAYIRLRLLSAIPTLLGVSFVVFFIMHVLPGDPVDVMLAETGASAARVAELRESMGLDRPFHEQYLLFLGNALQGDLGRSLHTNRSVTESILDQAPDTLELAAAAMIIAIVMGVTLGVVAAVNHNRWLDTAAMVYSTLGISMPLFWFGLIGIMIFSLRLRWVPTAGSGTWQHLILPATLLGMTMAAIIARLVRSSMLEVLRQEYITTARSKGIHETWVIMVHGLRNAMIPVITVIGLQFSGLLSGAVVIETIFSRRGIGSLAIRAVTTNDFPMVQGTVLFAAVIYVLINLLTDMMYGYLDPRIRHGSA